MNYTNQELEAQAYARGDTVTAALYVRIIELEAEVEQLEEKMSDIVTLESWEDGNGSADAYYEFFHDCFARLEGHYPCPSIGSDYDKGMIFDLITKGEGVTE